MKPSSILALFLTSVFAAPMDADSNVLEARQGPPCSKSNDDYVSLIHTSFFDLANIYTVYIHIYGTLLTFFSRHSAPRAVVVVVVVNL